MSAMPQPPSEPQSLNPHLRATADYIARLQLASGALPWFEGGITDPWDHVEAMMGLTIAGDYARARKALEWLANQQRTDGAWFAAYQDADIVDASRAETNFVAYVATGLWHYYLITKDRDTVAQYWPMVEAAIQFVLAQQAPTGEIYWAVDSVKGVSKDALITGCSSIFKSLACAVRLAEIVGELRPDWLQHRARLGQAIRDKPERFDRTWESKARYSMDWFYPILTGTITGPRAQARLDERWLTFVEPGLGCRCVADQPWVTVAETCELIMACVCADRRDVGAQLFDDLAQFQLADGRWWTGYVFTDQVHWPDEHPSWTSAAILLAADALQRLTPACDLFAQADEF